jgi:hypothetical protein
VAKVIGAILPEAGMANAVPKRVTKATVHASVDADAGVDVDRAAVKEKPVRPPPKLPRSPELIGMTPPVPRRTSPRPEPSRRSNLRRVTPTTSARRVAGQAGVTRTVAMRNRYRALVSEPRQRSMTTTKATSPRR